MNDDTLLTLREVSEFLHIPAATLYQYRRLHIGPPSFKLGTRVLYWRSGVLAWVAEHEAADQRYPSKDTPNATEGAPVTKRPPQSIASRKEVSNDGPKSARSVLR